MSRRLFMIWSTPIFRDSIFLLLDHPEIEWLGAASDYEAVQEEIHQLHPDAIVVEEVDGGLPDKVIELLETNNSVRQLICVSLEDNRLRIFTRENKAVAEASDLLQLVLEQHFSMKPGSSST